MRRELRACRKAFRACAGACAPGAPPEGAVACKNDAQDARDALLQQCKDDFVLSASACIDKDATCVDACDDARDQCRVPAQAALEEAVDACNAQRNAAVAQCQADFPDDQAALAQCIETVEASTFTCRDAALEGAAPGFAVCTQAWAECVQGCPAG